MAKEIELTQGKVALIDDEDYERVNQYKWQYCYNKDNKRCWSQRTIYVNGKKTSQHMHHFITNSSGQIDHKDHNGLNNQRENLRKATNSQNKYNSTKYKNNNGQYKGIYKVRNKWRAEIQFEKKKIHLGYFCNEIEAAKAYDEAAKIYFGKFALLNFG